MLSGWAKRLDRPTLTIGIRDEDILGTDLAAPTDWGTAAVPADRKLVINWVTSPPQEGSGGHTTAARLTRYLQAQGHECRIYFYDVYGGDFDYYRSIVHRSFADPSTEVGSVFDGMKDADAIFATSWETAYPVYNSKAAGARFYLVQDFEPWFYPRGAASVFAENTYRMGFHAITAGRWLAQTLAEKYGMETDSFDFGCDTDVYRLTNSPRNGIVFYARPQAPRRAFELGVLALELFAERHPDVEIHFYGNRIGPLRFPFTDHGLVTPRELNEIYNRCHAGLSLSITNVSLVPHEMLAAGCIPVVNDAEHNRVVLDNPHVRYASPDPHALAALLGEIVTDPRADRAARDAAASAVGHSWDDAGRAVEAALRDKLSPSAP